MTRTSAAAAWAAHSEWAMDLALSACCSARRVPAQSSSSSLLNASLSVAIAAGVVCPATRIAKVYAVVDRLR